METNLALLDEMEIRRTLHNNEWWFAVEDVVGALTDSLDPGACIPKIRGRDSGLAGGWRQFVVPLWLDTPGGRELVDCANAEGIFRIIQSIPSPKAEPFKLWLAKEACERIREMADPELVLIRTRELYRARGYSEAWIGKRMRGIAIRAELTDEWQKRGVGGEPEQALLTEEISRAAFGLTP
ncbi:MAG: Bro-N domain-containing protein, partial [Desulfobulbaceae bacterium]|nr:Bro-N domain-containing protein [Desulfobulbaceae bacterium]HIJ90630.1 Bro-N domain-containing protein [Deltaproteobacteria bacterium]